MTDKHADIRESLAKITPGPWVIAEDLGVIWNTDGRVVLYSLDANEEPDNHDFIANAPGYVRRLLSDNSWLNNELSNLQQHWEIAIGETKTYKTMAELQKQENERLRNALVEIAQAEPMSITHDIGYMQHVARKALEGKE